MVREKACCEPVVMMTFAVHITNDRVHRNLAVLPGEFMLDLRQRFEKEKAVSSVLIHKASELRTQTRAALEAELGRRLHDNEQVRIMVFVPHTAPTGKARREAGRRLHEHLNRIDEKTKSVPQAEMEAALDEALRSVRPGYRERK